MIRAIGNPGRYIQGPGVLKNLFKYGEHLGENFFVIISSGRKKAFGHILEESLKGSKSKMHIEVFNEECSMAEINRLTEGAKKQGAQVIIGMGGGKAIDTAKAVAYYSGTRLIIVPTSAAQDAPCLALSVIYKEDGTVEQVMRYPSNPDLVLVDSEIISKAPVRLFVSGIGDGIATYFESRACHNSASTNEYGYHSSLNSRMQARLCYDVLLAEGKAAYLAVKEGVLTKAVENVIEANIYLSGIAAEGSGDAGGHGIHNGLLLLPEIRKFNHGEIVAFGVLVQLVLENEPMSTINELFEFYNEIGLPVTLAQLDIADVSKERMLEVAEFALEDTLKNEPFPLTPEEVYNAILGADILGRNYLESI